MATDRKTDGFAPQEYGSDVIVDTLRGLAIEYIAMNPGATFRGIHDSLVNHLGNERPELILCNHEEIAVAIAQGAREEREQEPGGAFPRHHLEFKKKYVSGHIRKGFPVSLVSVSWRRSRARRSRRLTRGKGW